MATMASPMDLETRLEKRKDHFVVVHPLDDVLETKVNMDALGPMPMTRSVRLSLLSLRAYLVLMMLLVFYRVFVLAGLFGHHG